MFLYSTLDQGIGAQTGKEHLTVQKVTRGSSGMAECYTRCKTGRKDWYVCCSVQLYWYGVFVPSIRLQKACTKCIVLEFPCIISQWNCMLWPSNSGNSDKNYKVGMLFTWLIYWCCYHFNFHWCNCEVSQKALTVCGICRMLSQLWCIVIKSSNTVSARIRQGLFRIIPRQVGTGSPIKTIHTPWLQTSMSIYLLESQ